MTRRYFQKYKVVKPSRFFKHDFDVIARGEYTVLIRTRKHLVTAVRRAELAQVLIKGWVKHVSQLRN